MEEKIESLMAVIYLFGRKPLTPCFANSVLLPIKSSFEQHRTEVRFTYNKSLKESVDSGWLQISIVLLIFPFGVLLLHSLLSYC